MGSVMPGSWLFVIHLDAVAPCSIDSHLFRTLAHRFGVGSVGQNV